MQDEVAGWSEVAWWIAAIVMVFFVFSIFVTAVRVMGSKLVPQHTQREFSVAQASSFIFCLMVIPIVVAPVWNFITPNLQSNYLYIPFWYVFVLTKYIGEFYDVAAHSIGGAAIAVLYMVFLNYLMPGGATSFNQTEDARRFEWVPGGYKEWLCALLTVLFGYLVFLADVKHVMKQYILGFFASCVIPFMNPQESGFSFRAVVLDYKWQVNWGGYVLTSFYVILFAVPIAGLSLPVYVCWKRPRRFYSCRAQSAKGIASLSRDTQTALERMITYFREDTLNFDLDSSALYVAQLGTRRVALEALVAQAEWECTNAETKARLQILRDALRLLRGFRQLLRLLLDQLRMHGHQLIRIRTNQINHHLDEFLEGVGDALSSVSSVRQLHDGLSPDARAELRQAIDRIDTALVSALVFFSNGDGCCEESGRPMVAERTFIDSLRTCTVVLEDFSHELYERRTSSNAAGKLAALEEAASKASKRRQSLPRRLATTLRRYCPSNCFSGVIASKDQHFHAVRNVVSWTIALIWATSKRQYRATCMTSVAFIFAPTLGSLWERNTNRMIGVGLGLVLGELPGVITIGEKHSCLKGACFMAQPQGLIVYLAMMYLMWLCTSYGYLATRTLVGVRWSSACVLMAGYGGVRMFSNLRPFASAQAKRAENFDSILDNFLGCMIVFVVDICFARLAEVRTTDLVAKEVPACLEDIAGLLESMRHGCFHFSATDLNAKNDAVLDNPGLSQLQKRIASARSYDSQVHKQDLVFNSLRNYPYKSDLVESLLNRLDTASVALFGLLASVRRCRSQQEAAKLLREVLPPALASRCRTRAMAARAALSERPKDVAENRVRLDTGDEGEVLALPSARALSSAMPSSDRLLARGLSFCGFTAPEPDIEVGRFEAARPTLSNGTAKSESQGLPVRPSSAQMEQSASAQTGGSGEAPGADAKLHHQDASMRQLHMEYHDMLGECRQEHECSFARRSGVVEGTTSLSAASLQPHPVTTIRTVVDERREALAVETQEDATALAAGNALRAHAWALRMALQQVHVLLVEQVFWAAVEVADSVRSVGSTISSDTERDLSELDDSEEESGDGAGAQTDEDGRAKPPTSTHQLLASQASQTVVIHSGGRSAHSDFSGTPQSRGTPRHV